MYGSFASGLLALINQSFLSSIGGSTIRGFSAIVIGSMLGGITFEVFLYQHGCDPFEYFLPKCD